MRRDDDIVIGDKVDLIREKGRTYKTMVEDVIESVLFLVGVPRIAGIPMPLHVNDEVTMIFYRETGRYVASMKVAGFEKKGEIRYVLLLLASKPQQDQRRDSYRLSIRMKAQVCEYIEDIEQDPMGYWSADKKVVLDTVSSRDISVTGIALLTKREYNSGDKYLLRLFFNEPRAKAPPFFICSKVMRINPWRVEGMNNVGMQFFGQTKEMRDTISRYVLSEQQKQIKSRRLLESY